MTTKLKLRIAVADDDHEVLEYYRRMLTHLGHEVTIAVPNGRLLVERCRQNPPDLVVSDVTMSELGGIEAAGLLYDDPHLPVILISACDGPDTVRKATEQHVVKFIVKPVSKAGLERAIVSGMSWWRSQQKP